MCHIFRRKSLTFIMWELVDILPPIRHAIENGEGRIGRAAVSVCEGGGKEEEEGDLWMDGASFASSSSRSSRPPVRDSAFAMEENGGGGRQGPPDQFFRAEKFRLLPLPTPLIRHARGGGSRKW